MLARRRSLANLPITALLRMSDQPVTSIAPDRFVCGKTMLFVGTRRYCRIEERAGIASMWHAFGALLRSITYTIPGAAFGLYLAPVDPGDDRSRVRHAGKIGPDESQPVQLRRFLQIRQDKPGIGSFEHRGDAPSDIACGSGQQNSLHRFSLFWNAGPFDRLRAGA